MKYRKKPVVIEAMQYNASNSRESVMQWIYDNGGKCYLVKSINDSSIYIETLEGTMKADLNDYVIKGINGELYPCKPDIFEKTYEKVE